MKYITLENALDYWPPDALAAPRTWAIDRTPVFVGTAEEAKAWLHEQFGDPDEDFVRPSLTAEDLTVCEY